MVAAEGHFVMDKACISRRLSEDRPAFEADQSGGSGNIPALHGFGDYFSDILLQLSYFFAILGLQLTAAR